MTWTWVCFPSHHLVSWWQKWCTKIYYWSIHTLCQQLLLQVILNKCHKLCTLGFGKFIPFFSRQMFHSGHWLGYSRIIWKLQCFGCLPRVICVEMWIYFGFSEISSMSKWLILSNIQWPDAFCSPPQASGIILTGYFDLFIPQPTPHMCLRSVSCWKTQLCPSFNNLADGLMLC